MKGRAALQAPKGKLVGKKTLNLTLRRSVRTPALWLRHSSGHGTRRPLVSRREWSGLPNWIALHAERGPLRKCWEGHRLLLDTQDGRKHGKCRKCAQQPKAGTPILRCHTCCWAVCSTCAARPRLPRLRDDPLFHGPSSPCLLVPPGRPANAGRGTVIICPGGNYEFLCPNEGMPVAAWLAGHGIRALVLRYRLLPKHSLDDALDDFVRAVEIVRHNDNGPVAAIGFSAGGHLVASAALRLARERRPSRRPLAAQVLIYPCIDGTEWLNPETCGFFSADECQPRAKELLAGRAALLGGPGFAAPPTFLVGSTGDSCCHPKEHSDRYVRALKRRRVAHSYLRGDLGSHGFGLDGRWAEKCLPWLQKAGFGGRGAAGA